MKHIKKLMLVLSVFSLCEIVNVYCFEEAGEELAEGEGSMAGRVHDGDEDPLGGEGAGAHIDTAGENPTEGDGQQLTTGQQKQTLNSQTETRQADPNATATGGDPLDDNPLGDDSVNIVKPHDTSSDITGENQLKKSNPESDTTEGGDAAASKGTGTEDDPGSVTFDFSEDDLNNMTDIDKKAYNDFLKQRKKYNSAQEKFQNASKDYTQAQESLQNVDKQVADQSAVINKFRDANPVDVGDMDAVAMSNKMKQLDKQITDKDGSDSPAVLAKTALNDYKGALRYKQDMESSFNRVEKKVNDNNAALESARAESKQVDDQIESLETELKDKTRDGAGRYDPKVAEQLENELKAAKEKKVLADGKVKDLEQEQVDLAPQLKKAQDDLDHADTTLEESQTKANAALNKAEVTDASKMSASDIEDQISFLSKRSESIEKDIKDIDSRIAKTTDEGALTTLNKEKAALKSKLNKVNEENRDLQRYKKLLDEQKTAEEKFTSAQQALNKAQDKFIVARRELGESVNELKGLLKADSPAVRKLDAEFMKDPQGTLDRYKADIEQAGKQLEAKEKQITELTEEQSTVEDKITALKSKDPKTPEDEKKLTQLEERSAQIKSDLKTAEDQKTAIVEKQKTLNSSLVRATKDFDLLASRVPTTLAQDIAKKCNSLKSTVGKELTKVGQKISDAGRQAVKDGLWGTTKKIGASTGKGLKYVGKKVYAVGHFIVEQLKIGFAFLLPGDMVAAIQAAEQAKKDYAMITARQVFAGIPMWTVSGLIPKSDAQNGVFLYASTSDSDLYTHPSTRYFMSYDSFGNIGQSWLGSGSVTYMIEFATGFVFDNSGSAYVFEFPGVPMQPCEGYTYRGSAGNNTVKTIVQKALSSSKVIAGLQGHTDHKVVTRGILQGFVSCNESPAGNSVVANYFSTPPLGAEIAANAEPTTSFSAQPIPPLFEPTLNTLKTGLTVPAFGIMCRQVEGLSSVCYLLNNYQKIYDTQSNAIQSLSQNSLQKQPSEMAMLEDLTQSVSVADFDKVMESKYAISDLSLLGVEPDNYLLMKNVFVYETDDTLIAQMMKNNIVDPLKPYVHDYVVGLDGTGQTVIPILTPQVNVQVGNAVTKPVVTWTTNPNLAYVVSLVTGITYNPGLIPVLLNGEIDYSYANTVYNNLFAQGQSTGTYAGIVRLVTQINAMMSLSRLMVEQGPFQLKNNYVAYRVEGIENLFEYKGVSLQGLQQAQSAMLLGLAAQVSGSQIPVNPSGVTIDQKKNYVINNVFIYRIDNALAGGTLPDYVLPIMVNASGNFQNIPLGYLSQGTTSGISDRVQALVSLVTSRVYDSHYNILPSQFTTNIVAFKSPGVPAPCTVSNAPYQCVNGYYVQPGGLNQPLATAFMEVPFNPADPGATQPDFEMPPYHFLLINYDFVGFPAAGASTSQNQASSTYGPLSAAYAPISPGIPLYQILPELFTGLPWPSTIQQYQDQYLNFLKNAPQAPIPSGIAQLTATQSLFRKLIMTPIESVQQVSAQQKKSAQKSYAQFIDTMNSEIKNNTFNSNNYSIAQIHDRWRIHYATLNYKDFQLADSGPYSIGNNWKLTINSPEDIMQGNYVYNIIDNTNTPVPGLWVAAQFDNTNTAINESSLNTFTSGQSDAGGLPEINNAFQLCVITNPRYLQNQMLSRYNFNVQSRTMQVPVVSSTSASASTTSSASASTAAANFTTPSAPTTTPVTGYVTLVPYENMGQIESSFVQFGTDYLLNSVTDSLNAFIDLLSGRVLVATTTGGKNPQSYLVPLANRRGYEITVNVDPLLKKLGIPLNENLSTYVSNKGTYPRSANLKSYFAGVLPLSITRQLVDTGNYIYTCSTANENKMTDYVTPGINSASGAAVYNIPTEDQADTLLSVVDLQIVTNSSNSSVAAQQTAPQYEMGLSQIIASLKTGYFGGLNLFYIDQLSQKLLDGINKLIHKMYEVLTQTPSSSTLPQPNTTQETLQTYQNAVLNYENSNLTITPPTSSNNSGNNSNQAVESGSSFLFNDGNNNYIIGVGAMIGNTDSTNWGNKSAQDLFDTYYVMSLQGMFPSQFSNLTINGPIGGYFTKNASGTYVLTQTVSGALAQQIAATYGVYINPQGGAQYLSIPLPLKSLYMDPVADTHLQGGENTGIYMRYIKQLPEVPLLGTQGYTYYLYQNIATQNMGTAKSAVNLKPSPTGYFVQINPPTAPAYYLDYLTGVKYDMQGRPLTEPTYVYQRLGDGASDYNYLITWGQQEDMHMLLPITEAPIIQNLDQNNIAFAKQQTTFIEYAANFMEVQFWFQDTQGNQFYYTKQNPSVASGGVASLTGSVYKIDAKSGKILQNFSNGVTLGTQDASKLAELANSNMIAALGQATANNYTQISTVYTLHLFNMNIQNVNSTSSAVPSTVVLPEYITATYFTQSQQWQVKYAYTAPAVGSQPDTTVNVAHTYLPVVNTKDNNLMFKVELLNNVGYVSASDASNAISGAVALKSLSTLSTTEFNNNTTQMWRNTFLINTYNSSTKEYDVPVGLIAGGIYFANSSANTYSNNAIGGTISLTQEGIGQYIPNTITQSSVSPNAICYSIQNATLASATDAGNNLFASQYNFVYVPQYVLRPQSDLSVYYEAWQCEPEVSTEGTLAIIDYLDIVQGTDGSFSPANLIPLSYANVFVESVIPTNRKKGATGQSSTQSLSEYLASMKLISLKPYEEASNAIKDQVVKIKEEYRDISKSSDQMAKSSDNPYTFVVNPGGKKAALPMSEYLQAEQKKNMLTSQFAAIDVSYKKNYEKGAEIATIHNEKVKTLNQVIPSEISETNPPRLFFDSQSGYVVYQINPVFDSNKKFYAVDGITQGYILMPMVFTDMSQGSQSVPGMPTTYRFSGVVFDIDGRTVHMTVGMNDLVALEQQILNLGALEYGNQTANQITFNAALQLPSITMPSLTSASASTSQATSSTSTTTSNTSSVSVQN